MKANELRIGNLVTINNTVVTVEGVTEDGINPFPEGGWEGSHYIGYVGYFEGVTDECGSKPQERYIIHYIPLTEEWLKKFGFELSPMGGSYQKEIGDWLHVFELRNPGDGEPPHYYTDRCVYPLKYVQELQNVFSLVMGQEL